MKELKSTTSGEISHGLIPTLKPRCQPAPGTGGHRAQPTGCQGVSPGQELALCLLGSIYFLQASPPATCLSAAGVPWHRLAEPTGLYSVDTTKALTHALVIKAQFPLPSLALKVRLPFQQLVAEGGDVEEQNYLRHRHTAVGLSASQKNKKRNPVKSIAPWQSSS